MRLGDRLEKLANSALPAVELEAYEAGSYDSLDEIEDDLDEAWESYKRETGLEEFGSLEQVFEVDYSDIRDKLTVESADYRLEFGEDLRTSFQKLKGAESKQKYEAKLYTTQHFEKDETFHVSRFFTGFLGENFEPQISTRS